VKGIFKYIISVSFILLFVFPSVAEAVHQNLHKNDLHCRDFSTLHFHAGEHHCSFCDYVPMATEKQVSGFLLPFPVFGTLIYAEAFTGQIASSEIYFPSLRGPPVC
jgi:hypothetical protein